MILVDTNIWIDFFAGFEPSAGVAEQLLVERRAALSVVSVFELRAGVKGEKRLEQIEKLVSLVPPIPLSGEVALLAGELYTVLKGKGRLVSNEDLFIAATAIAIDVPVLTMNRGHFERIPGLEVMGPDQLGV